MMGKWFVAPLATAFFTVMALAAGCPTGRAGSGSGTSSSADEAGESSADDVNDSSVDDADDSDAESFSADDSDTEAISADNASGYFQKSSWYQVPEVTKDVDTFYVYSTMYMGENEGDPDYATLDNVEMLDGMEIEHAIKIAVFEGSTNVYVPYYRQASMKVEMDAWKKLGDVRAVLAGTPYEDITAALDYYFENYNDGRPFIIAGHGQGSAIIGLVLKDYFKEHPDYYERMVAAYMAGFSITKDELEDNPHLKFATGEDDAGVVVSWHAEGPENAELNVSTPVLLPGGVSINPLNWKLDDTYAPASANKGSLVIDEEARTVAICDIGADARVAPSRGTVVTNAKTAPRETVEIFGPQGYHEDDFAIFYNNVKENVAKRIATYKASH